MELQKRFSFEAAHRLPNVPDGHKCGRMHGHSFQIVVWIEGDLDAKSGWVQDFGDVTKSVKPVIDLLDHRCLNDVEGLENPTSEMIAGWLYEKLSCELPLLKSVEVMETCTSGCRYTPTLSVSTTAAAAEAVKTVEAGQAGEADRSGLSSVPADRAVYAIEKELNGWSPAEADVAQIAALSARTLDTVSRLTQYEDEKANRILAGVAFISAFVAASFASVANRYPALYFKVLWVNGLRWRSGLLVSSYVVICAYALLVAIGLSLTLWAVMPRFKTSFGWFTDEGGSKKPGWDAEKKSEPRSMLFFAPIAETHPAMWARAFRTSTAYDLNLRYSRDSIAESHLVADKIRYKVKWLRRGVKCFFSAAILVGPLMFSIVLNLLFTPSPQPQTTSPAAVVQPSSASESTRVNREIPSKVSVDGSLHGRAAKAGGSR